MRKLWKDMSIDMFMVVCEFFAVALKVMLVYFIVKGLTDLDHKTAMEVAILVGAVDFLNGNRTRFRTVTDLKEKVTLSSPGKRITRTFSKRTESG